jgi:hypothetical protein
VIRLVAAAAAGAALWLVALVTLSVNSSDRRLAPGEERTFGGFDPHLLVSLIDSGPAPGASGANTERLRVTLRYRSDAIEVRVRPSFLEVAVVDSQGREFAPVDVAPPVGAHAVVEPLSFQLAPGQSATQDFFFELPTGLEKPGVWVHDPLWLARWIPGSETSFGHGKTVFALR